MQHRTNHGHIDQIPLSSTVPTASNLTNEESTLQPGLLEKLLRRLMVLNHLSTEQFAKIIHVKPESVRSGLCRNGNYLGIQPLKLPNRRLAWPAKDVICLLNGENL